MRQAALKYMTSGEEPEVLRGSIYLTEPARMGKLHVPGVMRMSTLYSDRDRQFEEYLRDGISAAKSGNRKMAQSFLNRALYLNSSDARPYLWLSSTTDDPKEQREYLEKAVALEPTNVAARRGLAMLNGKLDEERVTVEGGEVARGAAGVEVDATNRAIQCPRCGGRMSFSIQIAQLCCEYCGFVQDAPKTNGENAGTPLADQAEQVMDFVMPTTRAHRWAESAQRVSCVKCGALSLLPPGQNASQCPYCGSNQVVESPEQIELLDPNVIAVLKVEGKQAVELVRRWLGKGLFSPDNLHRGSWIQLRPAYYSCWTFDGTIEMHWTCEVNEGSGDIKQWMPRSGVEARFFNDVLISGVKALEGRQLESLEPFNLVEVEEFQADYLAGWPAILYDRPLSDASLLAREKVIREMRPQVHDFIEIGREKRNVNIGSGNWSGMTFKHVLLPLWIGKYRFQGKEFQVMVNGQTGKVAGEKPRDPVKIMIAATSMAVMFLFLLLVLYLILSGNVLPF
jgi:DNA-directed RNA polymerase subunit RPC12/RpoP